MFQQEIRQKSYLIVHHESFGPKEKIWQLLSRLFLIKKSRDEKSESTLILVIFHLNFIFVGYKPILIRCSILGRKSSRHYAFWGDFLMGNNYCVALMEIYFLGQIKNLASHGLPRTKRIIRLLLSTMHLQMLVILTTYLKSALEIAHNFFLRITKTPYKEFKKRFFVLGKPWKNIFSITQHNNCCPL